MTIQTLDRSLAEIHASLTKIIMSEQSEIGDALFSELEDLEELTNDVRTKVIQRMYSHTARQ